MSEQMSIDRTTATSERTQLLRRAAIAKIDLMRDFMMIYPDFNQDSDMTVEQEATWKKLSDEPLAQIESKLEKLYVD